MTWMIKCFYGGLQWLPEFLNIHSSDFLKLLSCSWQKGLFFWLHCGRNSSKGMKGCIQSTCTPIHLSICQSLKVQCSMVEEFPARLAFNLCQYCIHVCKASYLVNFDNGSCHYNKRYSCKDGNSMPFNKHHFILSLIL